MFFVVVSNDTEIALLEFKLVPGDGEMVFVEKTWADTSEVAGVGLTRSPALLLPRLKLCRP
jgi:hypothetical protein